MIDAPIFRTFGAEVLEQRDEDGIRGIKSERNRFDLHVSTASFAELPVTEIRSRDVRSWLRDMARKDASDTRGARKLSTDTIKRAFALVSAVFAAAVEREIIETNPCAGVKVKRRADERATKDRWAYLTLDEQKAIAACPAISVADRLAIRFAVATGLRQGEQFHLLLSDLHVDGESPHVFVRFGSKNLPPKSGKTRRVPLFGDGLVAARAWLDVLPSFAPHNPECLAFPSRLGTRRGVGKPLGRGDAFPRALRAAGITRRVRWHDLRHTFCSNLVTGVLGRRWTLEEVRPLAGHSSITITERYSHIGERELVKAAAETAFAHVVPTAADTLRDLTAPPANDTVHDLDSLAEAS